jgi:predicted Fe-Mo cluster-binding NifX family protein
MPDMSVNAIKNESSEEELCKKVMDFDCEAVITGNLSQSAFDILADACITRYFGYGNSAEKALVLMGKNSLKLIRNVNGTEECSGNHH